MTPVYDEVGRRSNIKMLSSSSGVKLIFKMSPYINILGINLEKPYCPKIPINLSHENSDHFCRYVTRVYDDTEKWSIYQSVQYFIWSNTDVMNFVTVKYSLQQSDKTALHWNEDSPVIYLSHVTTISSVLKRIRFDHSGVIHISKRSVLYLE